MIFFRNLFSIFFLFCGFSYKGWAIITSNETFLSNRDIPQVCKMSFKPDDSGEGAICTASYIGEALVKTAAHCMYAAASTRESINITLQCGEESQTINGEDILRNPLWRPPGVEGVRNLREFFKEGPPWAEEDRLYDMAFAFLPESFSIRPLKIVFDDISDVLESSSICFLAGYGASSLDPDRPGVGTLRVARVDARSITYETNGIIIVGDEVGDPHIGMGDSGLPLLCLVDGELQDVGTGIVYTRGYTSLWKWFLGLLTSTEMYVGKSFFISNEFLKLDFNLN